MMNFNNTLISQDYYQLFYWRQTRMMYMQSTYWIGDMTFVSYLRFSSDDVLTFLKLTIKTLDDD